MPTNRARPPTVQPLPARVSTSSLVRLATEHNEVDKVVDMVSKKLAGTQPLGLLGLVKVSKRDLLRPRLFPVFLVAALGRNDSEHDAAHLWRCRDAVFEARVGFRAVLLLRGEEALHIVQGLAQARESVKGSHGFASP